MTGPGAGPVPVRELAGCFAGRDLALGSDGAPASPFVLVDLDGSVPDLELARGSIERSAAVCVGVSRRPLSAAAQALAYELACTLVPFDVSGGRECVPVADPEGEAGALARAVSDNPRAAMSLIQLLRMTDRLPVRESLCAESAVYSLLLAGPEFATWMAGRAVPRPDDDRGSPVRLTRCGDVLEVLLDRPARCNAFGRRVRDGLVEAFDLVNADRTIRRVDLRGAGPAFCGGGDLAEFGSSCDVSAAHLIRMDRSIAGRLDRCRGRVVAHLHGACVGAGIEIPSFAGRVEACEGTYVVLPELHMGLIPGAGGTVGISRRIGRWRTAYLALSGAALGASAALGWGLVDEICDE